MSIVHNQLKLQAIDLRGKGFSYNEILLKVPVAKSTLSLWLRSVSLSKKQIHRLTEKKRIASIKGGETRRRQRVLLTKEINKQALVDIKSISKRELWLMGIMLYWGEGAKAIEHNISQGMIFSNTDPLMINMFIKWLKDCLQVRDTEISFEIYTHIKAFNGIEQVTEHWASKTGFPKEKFVKIYFKHSPIRTNRKNKDDGYYGLLRVRVSKSTNLNRKITGWVEAIAKRCGIV